MNESRAETDLVPQPRESTDPAPEKSRLAPAEAVKEALQPAREHEGVWFPKVQLRLAPARRPA